MKISCFWQRLNKKKVNYYKIFDGIKLLLIYELD